MAVLPARRRLHAARDEVDHPVRAAVGIDVGRRVAGDRVGAGDGARWPTVVVSRVEIRRPWLVGAALLALLALNYVMPVGRVAFESRVAESLFYAVLMFSPILCAGPAVRIGDQALDVARPRLRHQPARRDGRRRRRVPVARDRLPRAPGRHRALLHRGDCGTAERLRSYLMACSYARCSLVACFHVRSK